MNIPKRKTGLQKKFARMWANKIVIIYSLNTVGSKNKDILEAINLYFKTPYSSLLLAWLDLGKGKGFVFSDRERIANHKIIQKEKRKNFVHGDSFYKSKEWQKIRFDALLKNDGCCVLCGRSKLRHDVVLHVDHIKPRSKFPELQLDATNIQILCEDCNLGKSNRDDTDFRKDTSYLLRKGIP